jgi:hypothetical protein
VNIADAMIGAEATVEATLDVDVYSYGKQNDSKANMSYVVETDKTRYANEGLNLTGDTVKVQVNYTGTNPPTYHALGVRMGDTVAV